MREKVSKRLQAQLKDFQLGYNPKCEDPNCNHKNCIKDEDTDEYYKSAKVLYQLEPDELNAALLAEQLAQLRSIRSMIMFFTVITLISMFVTLAVALSAGAGFASLFR